MIENKGYFNICYKEDDNTYLETIHYGTLLDAKKVVINMNNKVGFEKYFIPTNN